VVEPFDWDTIDLTLQDSAARYECGTPNLPGLLVLRDNLAVLEAVGIESIHRHVTTLGDQLIAGLDGWQIVSPRGPGEAGGAVVFRRDDVDMSGLVNTLRKEKKTELAMRSGRMRFSPHFYNTPAQVARLIENLRQFAHL
jgi:selenocysteine lyase/cysteine desulfurase